MKSLLFVFCVVHSFALSAPIVLDPKDSLEGLYAWREATCELEKGNLKISAGQEVGPGVLEISATDVEEIFGKLSYEKLSVSFEDREGLTWRMNPTYRSECKLQSTVKTTKKGREIRLSLRCKRLKSGQDPFLRGLEITNENPIVCNF